MRKLIRVMLSGDKKPPKEFKVFSKGVNKTTKGDIVLSARSIKAVFAHEQEMGRDLVPFDYGHAQVGFVQGHDQARSAGWGKLSDRGGDIWVEGVEWTPTADKALSDREYRYFSPAIDIDPKTREVLTITNIALTNLPATKNQTPLIASDTPQPAAAPTTPETTSMDEKTLIKLFVALGVDDAGAILGRVQALAKERQQLFDAVKEIQTKLSTAEAALEEFRKTEGDGEKAALIETLAAAGKLTPALKKWAASQSLETVKSFGDVNPVNPVVNSSTVTPPEGSGSKKSAVLTDDEKKLLDVMEITAEEYLATKETLTAQEFYFRTDPKDAPAAPQETK